MSGECDKCGEHCVDCKCTIRNEKDQFYYEGKFFETFEEMVKFAKEWLSGPLNQESADRHLNILKKEIIMNIFLRGIEITNSEFNEILNEIFEFAIFKLDQKNAKNHKFHSL